jgi:hypothetical protein
MLSAALLLFVLYEVFTAIRPQSEQQDRYQ